MNWLLFLAIFLKSSLFSTGGPGGLPILHQDLLTEGWANDDQFTQSLAIGQLSPGPSGLWVVSLGYLSFGFIGAFLALVAICLPPFLILILDSVHQSLEKRSSVAGFMIGLKLAVVGSMLFVAFNLMSKFGSDWRGWFIALGSGSLAFIPRLQVWIILLLAGGLGYLIYGL